MTRRKVRALWVTAIVLLGAVAGIATLGAPAAAAGNQSTTQVEVVDVGKQNGNLYVTLNATTSEPVTDFQFWYNDTSTATKVGPTQYVGGTGDFVSAYYTNNTGFNPGDPISTSTPDVQFVFDSDNTDYDYVTNPFLVNVSAFSTSYAGADGSNRSVITGGHYNVSVEDHNGNPLANIPLSMYGETTNESQGFGFIPASTRSVVFHCRGVESGNDCTNPDTNSPGTLTENRSGMTYSAPVTFEALSLSQSNSTGKQDISQGRTTLTADRPSSTSFLNWGAMTGGGTTPAVDEIYVTNESSGNVVWQNTNVDASNLIPMFLDPNVDHNVTLKNESGFGTEVRQFASGSKGMSFVNFRIDTQSVPKSTVTGKVVNESGDPVSDVVVFAEPDQTTGKRIDVYNATTTDSNGIFTMTLPQTSQISNNYGFRMVGTDADGGTPIYYPTPDANDGDGYVATSGNTVLPPMTIEKGGRLRVDVSGTIPGRAFSALSGTSTAYPSMTREANSNSFQAFSFGKKQPSSASVAMMSPTTGAESQVAYNIWGQNSPMSVCGEEVSVSQGVETTKSCTLSTAGYLNISVEQYGSILQQSGSSYADVEGFGFFWNNELVVRDANNGNLMTYLGPDGAQQYMLSRPGSPNDIKIPVPAGDYSVHLRPANDWVRKTTVNDTATYSVTATSTTDVTLDRAEAFRTRPVFDRMTESLTRSKNNVLAVRVYDPKTRSKLTDSDPVTVTARLLYKNGTVASSAETLTYNATDGTFDTTTFKPSDRGVSAGSYQVAVTVSYSSGTRTYNSTVSGPVQVSGFGAGMELGTRTATPGDSVLGRLFAYDDGSGLSANNGDIDIKIYDQNDKLVSTTNPSNDISSGEGSFSVTVPSDPGRYRVETKIDTGSKQGIAQEWIRVSEVDLSVSTDRDRYKPGDTVTLEVEATNSTSGNAISDASIEARINNQRITASTDSEGTASIELDPSTYASKGSSWQRGHPIGVTLLYDTGSDVVRKTDGTTFEVQAFTARAEPTSERFGTSEQPTIDVNVPTSVSVTGVTLSELDGETNVSAASTSNPASGVRRVTLNSQPVGSHVATVQVKTQSSGSQTATTQFAVRDNAVEASLSKRVVNTGETVDLDVVVRDSNGDVVSGENVEAWLNATDPVRNQDTASGSTSSDGTVTLSMSSSTPGKHVVKVKVGQQIRYLGLRVSDVNARLEDSNGNEVSGYEATVGTSETLYVNATTSGGADVPDGSQVAAVVRTLDGTVELGTAKTTNGDASIDFRIPQSVAAREYTLGVEVLTDTGSGGATGTLNVTGSNSYQIEAAMNQTTLTPGESTELQATVSTGDGSAVTSEPVDFVLQTDGTADTRVATVSPDSNGVATYNHTIASDASDGEWVLKAALNNSKSIKEYEGYRVRSIDAKLVPESGPFNPGDSVPMTLYVNDSSTGNAVSATGGTLTLKLPGSNVEQSLSLSGSSPYSLSVTLPSDSSITGTRPISVTASKDASSDTAANLIDVESDTESANLSISTPVTAGQSTTVTVNGTVDETAVLTALSPNAGSVAYNSSVSVSSTSDTQTGMTIDSAGLYLVKLEVPQVGTVTETVQVQPSGSEPAVWAGPDLSSNATSFDQTEDIYIKTNQSGMSATIVSQGQSYSVPLDSQSGSTYYGVISRQRATGTYFVRLDSDSATGVADTVIEVSS